MPITEKVHVEGKSNSGMGINLLQKVERSITENSERDENSIAERLRKKNL